MNDRFLKACRLEPVDATPIWFMRQAGRALPEFRRVREKLELLEIVRRPEVCAEVTLQPVTRYGVDAAILFADITVPLVGMGVDFEIRPGVGPVIHAPLKTAADVAALRPFEPGEHVAPLLEAIGLIRQACPVPLIGFAGGPFTLASYLLEGGPTRTFAATKALLHGDPPLWHDLLDRLTTMTISYLGAQAAAGAQALQVFDSWVGALSPRDYREAVQPHMRRLFAALPDVPVIHFGTGTAGLLPDLAAAGGDVIGVDWRIDLDWAWELIGPRGIQGNLDPAVVVAGWEATARHARGILAAAAGRPGHVFNLGHGVLPATDPLTLRRLVEFVHEESARRP